MLEEAFLLLGNRAFEYGMRKVKDGDEVDWRNQPKWLEKSLIYNTFYSWRWLENTLGFLVMDLTGFASYILSGFTLFAGIVIFLERTST